jgi:hypothetical protein
MKAIKNIVLTSALLLVFAGCAGDRYHRSTGAYFDDKGTSAKIKADLYSDPMVSGTDVRVRVYQGKVQLAGFVDCQQEKDRAGEIARRINGVQWVKNDLIIKSQMPGGIQYAPTVRTYKSSVNEPAGGNIQGNVNSSGASVSTSASKP